MSEQYPSSSPPPYPQPGPGHGGPAGHDPRPARRRTGLVVGIAAALLVAAVVAVVAVTLVVTSGDDDPDDGPGAASSSETPARSAATTPSTAGSATDRVIGDGYTFERLGEAWTNVTLEARGPVGRTLDMALALGPSLEQAKGSIIVTAHSARGADSAAELEETWRRGVDSGGVPSAPVERITIDGERAVGVRIEGRVDAAGDPVVQIGYLAVHTGGQYTILGSFKVRDEAAAGDFQKVLATWRWNA